MPATIRTVSAECQDCYRCVRKCPIDAIWVSDRQAYIQSALCIQCGNCVRECPQHAKVIQDSLSAVKGMIAEGQTVVASVDPSFPAAFPGFRAARLPAALRFLGFAHVAEAAAGARAVADASRGLLDDRVCISSQCAAVVSYIEKYRHALIPALLPVVSPMIAHGRMLKAHYGRAARIVHIGPCAARKNEAARPKFGRDIDAVLTYDELFHWLSEEKLSLANCPETGFDPSAPVDSAARLTAIEGGMLHALGLERAVLDPTVLRVSGAARVMNLLNTPPGDWGYRFAELSFCRGGCAGGPCMPPGSDLYTAARDVQRFAESAAPVPGDAPEPPLAATFTPISVEAFMPPVDEAEVERILSETGKGESRSRLNCGACGYNTCRENAIAVARGSAEPGMCAAFTRKRAERRADRIIETSPNGIIVVDMSLTVVHMNARFMRMFDAPPGRIGLPVSHIVDAEGFEKLISGASGTQEAIRTRGEMKYQELIYTLPGENEIIGIYVDVSKSTFSDQQFHLIRRQSLAQAQQLLRHQIRFSQEMAHFLGKTTAQTEELVDRMVSLFVEGDALEDMPE